MRRSEASRLRAAATRKERILGTSGLTADAGTNGYATIYSDSSFSVSEDNFGGSYPASLPHHSVCLLTRVAECADFSCTSANDVPVSYRNDLFR